MLKFTTVKTLALSLAVIALPFMATAESLDPDHTSFFVTASHDAGHHCLKEKHIGSLTLSDFAGRWTFAFDSVGGVSTTTGSGSSDILDGQVTFDNNGHGTINFLSSVGYGGTVGSVFQFAIPPGTGSLALAITDPVNGVVTVTLSVSFPHGMGTGTAEAVVIRSKECGKAIEMQGHLTSTDSDAVATFNLFRQYQ